MGYDLHITRRNRWNDKEIAIAADEWLAYIASPDSELHLDPANGPYFAIWSGPSEDEECWLDWSDGWIHSKYPEPALIGKMIAIAKHFNAEVQGDDGEIYFAVDKPPRQPRLSLLTHFEYWLRRLRPHSARQMDNTPLPFGEGDRVTDVFGNKYTIVRIEHYAVGPLGRIYARRDDGMESIFFTRFHHLRLLQKEN